MLALKFILLLAVVNIATAYITPERCQDSAGDNGSGTEPIKAQIATNLTEAFESYEENVKSLYKDYKVYNLSVEGSYDEKTGHITVNSTKNCEFETSYNYLSNENCGRNDKCTIDNKVPGTEYFFTAIGHKWGATVSNKSAVITIGGEASTAGRYPCYNNKNHTTNRIVECSTDKGAGKNLYLIEFLTSMRCDIGTTDLEPALRDNKTYETAPENYFTKSEKDDLLAAASITYLVDGFKRFHINIDKISRGLVDKLITIFPNYDFSTDTISIKNNIVDVNYYQATDFRAMFYSFIPFTNEYGDAIYQYVCSLE